MIKDYKEIIEDLQEINKGLTEDIKQLEEVIAMLVWQIDNPTPFGINQVVSWTKNTETIATLKELQKQGKFPIFKEEEIEH